MIAGLPGILNSDFSESDRGAQFLEQDQLRFSALLGPLTSVADARSESGSMEQWRYVR